ncbi:MAG: hypothetical protein ABIP19_11460 [Dermatophilaceae bacterium]
MIGELRFADAETLADLGTYVTRARSLDPDGAIRLQTFGSKLAAYVGVLPGHGLMTSGAIVGLRVMALAEPVGMDRDVDVDVDVDVTVSLASVAERLARGATSTLSIPPTMVSVAWAANAPPRSGWERVGELGVADLKTVATQGIAEIAQGAPEGAGAAAVAVLRQRVWTRDSHTTPPIPSGAAFAAYALGFLMGENARVFAHGRWTRLSTGTGHVLVR